MKYPSGILRLVNEEPGEFIRAAILPRPIGGRFMKVWQGGNWGLKLKELQGRSKDVLLHLVDVALWGNLVPGPGETAKALGMHQTNVIRAYKELLGAGFLRKLEGGYQLSPYFCWRGSNAQYEQATTGGRPLLTSPPLRQLAEARGKYGR